MGPRVLHTLSFDRNLFARFKEIGVGTLIPRLRPEAGKSPLRRILGTSLPRSPPTFPACLSGEIQLLRSPRRCFLEGASFSFRLSSSELGSLTLRGSTTCPICFPLAHGVELGKIHREMVCPFHSFNICSESFEVLHITTSGVPPAHSSKFISELALLFRHPLFSAPRL